MQYRLPPLFRRPWTVNGISPSLGVALIAASSLLAAATESAAMPATTDALTLERKIPLGEVSGRIDHLAVDLPRRRVFIAELGNGSIGIVDLDAGKVVHRIGGLKEPQGVAYLAGADTVYVASAGDGTLRRYRGSDFAPLGTTPLGDDADNVRIDPRTNEVVVGYGSGALAVLDPASGAKRAELPLAGHPESFQLEPDGTRIFVNVPDAHQVAVVDRGAGRQVAAWRVPDAAANFPMALVAPEKELAVVFRRPALLVLFDTRDGHIAARLPTCGDADDVFYDARRARLYVSCGEGALAVVARQGTSYAELGRVPTASGARTALWVPDLERLFLAVRAHRHEPAALWVFRPAEP